jgi:hypothetical protein
MSEKIYGWLLKLYPARFRAEYGAAVMQLFRDRLRAERSIFGRFRLWLDVIADLAISIPREHWRPNPAQSTVGGYRLSEEAVTAMWKRSAAAPAVFVVIFGALGLTAAWLGNSPRALLFAAYLPLAIFGMMRVRSLGRFKQRWRSYELMVEADRIRQRQPGRDLVVLRSEIVKVNESQHELYVIAIRAGRPMVIQIPAGLIGYQQVRDEVCQWAPHSERRDLWLSDPGPVVGGLVALLPALLLVRSLDWFVIVAAVYYGLVVLLALMNVFRPPRNSGLTPRRRGWSIPPAAYMWRRLKHQSRWPPLIFLIVIVLPLVRVVFWLTTP